MEFVEPPTRAKGKEKVMYTRDELNQKSREELINIVMDQQWALEHQARQNRVLSAFTTGGLEKVTSLLEQAENEREQARAVADRMARAIDNERLKALDSHLTSLEKAKEAEKLIQRAIEEGYQPHLVEFAVQIYNVFEEFLDTIIEDSNIIFNLVPAKELSPYQAPETILFQTRCLTLFSAKRIWGTSWLQRAYSLSSDARLICDHICRSLRKSGEVDISVLKKLGEQWIQDNIPDAPAKLKTVKEQLELSEEFLRSGNTIEEFADQKSDYDEWQATVKRIKRANALREKFESWGRQLPDEIKQITEKA